MKRLLTPAGLIQAGRWILIILSVEIMWPCAWWLGSLISWHLITPATPFLSAVPRLFLNCLAQFWPSLLHNGPLTRNTMMLVDASQASRNVIISICHAGCSLRQKVSPCNTRYLQPPAAHTSYWISIVLILLQCASCWSLTSQLSCCPSVQTNENKEWVANLLNCQL